MREVGYNQWGKKPFDFTPFGDLKIFDRAMSIVEWQSFFTHCLTPTPADAPHRPPPSEAPMSKHTVRAK